VGFGVAAGAGEGGAREPPARGLEPEAEERNNALAL
jgi:hypothetical protein